MYVRLLLCGGVPSPSNEGIGAPSRAQTGPRPRFPPPGPTAPACVLQHVAANRCPGPSHSQPVNCDTMRQLRPADLGPPDATRPPITACRAATSHSAKRGRPMKSCRAPLRPADVGRLLRPDPVCLVKEARLRNPLERLLGNDLRKDPTVTGDPRRH